MNTKSVLLLAVLGVAGCGTTDLDDHTAAITSAASLTTDAASYSTTATVTATWGGLPGNAHDWIALAPAGSDLTTAMSWTYTNGATSGVHAFGSIATPGSYVVRAFSDDTYTLLVESTPFSVATASGTVTTDAATYTVSQTINASWTGLPGTATDWIAIAPAGSDTSTITAWSYTGGAAAGSHAFAGLATTGNYVVRVFPNDSYSLLAEAPFAVSGLTVSITTDSSVYGFSAPVTISWTGLPGNQLDWIAIAPQSSPDTTVTSWVYTNGQASGSAVLTGSASAGAFVARAFVNDSYSLIGESAAFNVGLDISTDKNAYSTTDNVIVSWQNLTGGATDWIAIAPSGSPNTTVTNWVYTGGAANGSHSFPALGAGSYVARAFLNDSYTRLAESAPFTVGSISGVTVSTDAATYGVNQDITVNWSGLPGNNNDWIVLAPAGSGDTTTTRWVYTAGATSGSYVFSGGLGTTGSYVARAFFNDTYQRLGESTPFDVQ